MILEEIFPYPLALEDGRLLNGKLNSYSSICKNCVHKECIKIGKTLNINEVSRCSYGFNFTKIENFEKIFAICISFLLSGIKYPNNHKILLKDGFEIDSGLLNRSRLMVANGCALEARLATEERKKESRVLHDLKHLVTAMQRILERFEVERATSSNIMNNYDWILLKKTADSAYKILSAIKNQIKLSDYIISPELIGKFTGIEEINIDALLVKNIGIYNLIAEQDNKRINPMNRSQQNILAHRKINELFVLLPPILLEDAIKYSFSEEINVREASYGDKLEISVYSFGVIIPDNWKDKIWDLGGQYIDPNDTSKGGGGYGLFLAKRICEACNFDIIYEARDIRLVNGLNMGWNIFTLRER